MKLKTGQPLRDQAKKYRISLEKLPAQDPSDAFNDPEIQRRVMEFQRHRRDARLWIVAVGAAVFSALSAAAAWYAALCS